MKKKSKYSLVIGLVVLIIGTYLYFQVDGQATNRQNTEIAMTATNAEDAAKQIAANNSTEVGDHSFAMFLLGLGGALTLLSLFRLMRKNSS